LRKLLQKLMKQLKKKSNGQDLNDIDVITEEVSPSAEEEQRFNELSQMGPGELLSEIMKLDQEDGLYDESEDLNQDSNIYTQEDMDAFNDWDVTLVDGLEDLEWDEDHALDQVLNQMVEGFTEEEIQELINEIPEDIEESIESLEDGEFVFEEGPYTFETDQEVAEIETKQSEEINVGMGAPVEEPVKKTETIVDRSNTGSANFRPRVTRVIEDQSTEVKQPVPTPNLYTQDEEEDLEALRYKKGPKWQVKNTNNGKTI